LKEGYRVAKTMKLNRETLKKLTDPLLLDEEKAERFVANYKRLRRLFEFLGAHPKKLQYRDEFIALTEIYYTYLHRKRDSQEAEQYIKKYFPRTLEIIHQAIDIGRIKQLFPEITLDNNYLEKLKQTYPDLEERVYNMIFDLRKFIYVEKSRTPYLETIGERVNKILRELQEKKAKIEEAHNQLTHIVNEVVEINKRRKELTDRELSIILPIEKYIGRPPRLIDSIKALIAELENEGMLFQGWNQKKEVTKKVGLKIRSFLRKLKLTFEEREQLFNEIMKNLTQLG
jgi:type I site-specific restriction-modification system R (restriction) subunit